MNGKLDRVVCVCALKDLPVWKCVAPRIVERIGAQTYEVVVPDADYLVFLESSPEQFHVVKESAYAGARDLNWLKDRLPQRERYRVGWYFQQFLKLWAVLSGNNEDIVLIWDADTLPLKKQRFLDNGTLLYYKSRETHDPYFDLIDSVLHLESDRKSHTSFVAQSFPVKVAWAREMCTKIESEHHAEIGNNEDWVDVLLRCLNGPGHPEFSEYETLGAFIAYAHGDEIRRIDNRWYRYGASLLGGIDRLTPRKERALSLSYDFVSFEHWDKRHWYPGQALRILKTWLRIYRRYLVTRMSDLSHGRLKSASQEDTPNGN